MTRAGPDGEERPVDLRLAGPALAAWAGAAGAGLADLAPAVLLIAGMLLGAALVCAAALVRRPRVWRPAATGLAVLACLAAGVLTAGVTTHARIHGPFSDLGAARAVATVEGKITGDPRISRGGGTQLVVVPVRVERLRAGGREFRLRQPVLVLATATGWAGLLPSQRVRAEGNLAPPRAADTVAAVLFVRLPPVAVGGPSAVQAVAAHLRQGLRDAVSGLDASPRGLLPGLVVGDTSDLDESLKDDFRVAGMSHLVAVSGANCAIVIAAATLLVRRSRLGPWLQAGWVALALSCFVILARPSPSVLRASVMGMIGILAAGSGRQRGALPALCATVLMLVLVSPDLARSVGFTLSVFATAGLVIIAPGWRERLSRQMPTWLAELLAVAAAAHVACAPVLAAIGGGVSLVAIPANMLADAAVAPATVLGVLATVAAVCWMPLARLFAALAGVPCKWLIMIASVAARAPGAQIGWPAGPLGAMALVAATVATFSVLRRRGGRRVLAAAGIGAFTAQAIFMFRSWMVTR